ncbi:MAG: helix-turn-helix transcriptional regulator [Caldilineaceae bacterium]|nr:helix-turn-helix transcriptional regulator [Caldilineaceae bacterium]
MFPSDSTDNPIAKRIREAVSGLRQTKERTVIPIDTSQERVNSSIRTLARSRVSNILRQLRSASGYSYEDLTEKTGLPKQLLFDIEYKEQRLTLDQLRLLADCYGVEVNDILGVDVE